MASGLPNFSKRWSSRFAQKRDKIGTPEGGGVRQIYQAVVFEILEKQGENGFLKVWFNNDFDFLKDT